MDYPILDNKKMGLPNMDNFDPDYIFWTSVRWGVLKNAPNYIFSMLTSYMYIPMKEVEVCFFNLEIQSLNWVWEFLGWK